MRFTNSPAVLARRINGRERRTYWPEHGVKRSLYRPGQALRVSDT